MIDAVCVEEPIRRIEPEVAPEVDDTDSPGEECHRRIRRSSVWKGEECEVNVGDRLGVVCSEDSIPPTQVRMNGTERHACSRVSPEIFDLEVGMAIYETDQLTAGVTGRTKDGDGLCHGEPLSEAGIYAYALSNALLFFVRFAAVAEKAVSAVGARQSSCRHEPTIDIRGCAGGGRCANLENTPPGGVVDSLTPIIAHQYGWDEVLLFVVPVVIAVIVVRRLDKRPRFHDDTDEDE